MNFKLVVRKKYADTETSSNLWYTHKCGAFYIVVSTLDMSRGATRSVWFGYLAIIKPNRIFQFEKNSQPTQTDLSLEQIQTKPN